MDASSQILNRFLATNSSTNITDPLESDCELLLDNYSKGPHIAAVFIILVASALGAGIPILATYFKTLKLHPYPIIAGKCMGTGVVLSCGFIHMLLPGNEALTSECISEKFVESYEAYAYLFAVMAGLGMQFIDFLVLQRLIAFEKGRREQKDVQEKEKIEHYHGAEENLEIGDDEDRIVEIKAKENEFGHLHGVALDSQVLRSLEAYMIEFGVTVHSLFVGLAVGVVSDDELKALLVALVFHQFFEGVALGSRVADAQLPGWQQSLLFSIFTLSAPIGIGAGVAVSSSFNPESENFLVTQGVFDSVCAGILIYIGFGLLLHDFPRDIAKYSSNRYRAGMFIALWTGAGLMAFVGKYL